jgi:hypothetical protein
MRSYAAFAGCFEAAALERLIRASFIKFCDCLDSSEGRESFFCHYILFLFFKYSVKIDKKSVILDSWRIINQILWELSDMY